MIYIFYHFQHSTVAIVIQNNEFNPIQDHSNLTTIYMHVSLI